MSNLLLSLFNQSIPLGLVGLFVLLAVFMAIMSRDIKHINKNLDNHITDTNKKIDKLEATIEKRIDKLEAKFEKKIDGIENKLDKLLNK